MSNLLVLNFKNKHCFRTFYDLFVLQEDKKEDKKEKKEEKKEDKDLSSRQAIAVLGIALIAMGEEIGSEMAFRTFGHLVSTLCVVEWAGIAQSVQRLATGWTVQGLNPGRGEIFCTHPDRPWGPPSLVYNGYWVFPGGKAAGAWH